MQILSLTTIFPNEQSDAEGRSVMFLDQALAKMGVGGTTLVLKPWVPHFLAKRVDQWKHLAVRRRIEERDGTRVIFSHYMHISVRYRLDLCVYSMAHQAIQLIKRNGWTFDVVHGESIYPAALASRLVAQHFKVPFIITLRDDLSHLSSLYEGRKAKKLFEPMFASVSAIFAIGPKLMKDIPKFLPSSARPLMILAPNGIDVDSIDTVLNTLQHQTEHPWGHIVSVGNLYRFKGIHENLHALKLLHDRGMKDWRYTAVGEGPYRRDLESLAKESGFGDRVVFTGRLPHREAIRMIHESDLFCLPSWAEPFGNVFAETAVCGRPAIGCRGFGAELTIRDGETGLLVPPRDVDALAEALAYLLTHPEHARDMGQKARDHIRQFTWKNTAELYKQAMTQILKPTPIQR
jgi:glycosyltransferase involved in cell wall biosynthesis